MTLPLDIELHDHFPLSLPVSQAAIERLSLELPPISSAARPGSLNVSHLRTLSDRLNRQAGAEDVPTNPGDLVSAAVIIDVLRFVMRRFCGKDYPGTMTEALDEISETAGRTSTENTLAQFVQLYPPPSVALGNAGHGAYLSEPSLLGSNRELSAGELALTRLCMLNRAFRPFVRLFDDTEVSARSTYRAVFAELEASFERRPPFPPLALSLFKCLRLPMESSPDSLEGQLDFIRREWAWMLPAELLSHVMLARDILREERLLRGFGPGELTVLDPRRQFGIHDDRYPEPAAFSEDADWMSNVVLIAKSIYVWLDQLSRKYNREVRRLNEIPDEELDQLARWGFNGLWLIGLWERSPASEDIKRIMGNPEAMASAYSLYDYDIANDLGGDGAYASLRERCRSRGIRLAADMVPNHVGVFSRWVIEHPDWFVQSGHLPFPSYGFTGTDLSRDERVTIQIEDGYWNHRDAAVVFRRLDRWTGEERYIYHGNDGTSMPWNDTAQLNFLLPEVREAVVQTILHVARKFSIIRFDAAMTMAKKHFQRLWFPQPGDGGAIPSRAEHGLTREQFDAAFPKEFWREVVDRVKAEVPDTLLLAEAFWLMEGYFVRTLGMHRVYNSAFMNMLKSEDNSKYRQTIKNVMEFSPEILKRFVNFMNNPDEQTAVAQFGREDKYFGVAMMMVTMPGLPMFGHGQVEGFTEKYGMEYRRAYWDESVDRHLVWRHEREIFPLMRRRYLFSGVEHFALFDFESSQGWVDENVFAYCNRAGDERALIAYNNAYNTTSGWLRMSTQVNRGSSEEPRMVRRSLSESLGLRSDPDVYYVFGDHRSGLEHIRSGEELSHNGLHLALSGYQYQVFLGFHEIHDSDGSWGRLARQLHGEGVPSVSEAYRELMLEPVLEPFSQVLSRDNLRSLDSGSAKARERVLDNIRRFYTVALRHLGVESGTVEDSVNAMLSTSPLEHIDRAVQSIGKIKRPEIRQTVSKTLDEVTVTRQVLLVYEIVSCLEHTFRTLRPEEKREEQRLYHHWLLGKSVRRALEAFAESSQQVTLATELVPVLSITADLCQYWKTPDWQQKVIETLDSPQVADLLRTNEHEGVWWFSKEQLELLAAFLIISDQLRAFAAGGKPNLARSVDMANELLRSAADARYRWIDFKDNLSTPKSRLNGRSSPPVNHRR